MGIKKTEGPRLYKTVTVRPAQTRAPKGIVSQLKIQVGPTKAVPGSRLKSKPPTGRAMMR